ncbi:MAG: glutamyl-tRNA reductase [Actinomycetota bacterium]|nr:glutamyl-tRNA reductase [Actinomycetota bacterium]
MSLVVIGLNHRTTPVELLERMAVPATELAKALHALDGSDNLAEVAVLSTCNRTEVYAHCTRFHPAVEDVRNFLTDQSSLDPDAITDHLYTYHDDAAVAHLFGVSAGVDSMIVGEGEILGQVREAWRIAERERMIGPLLSRAFRQAVEVGKRARTETGIGRHAVSVSSAAVAVAGEQLGGLDNRRVLVIGAGDVGTAMAIALNGAGVGEIVVANRSPERANELAARVGGRAIALEGVNDALVAADVVLASTSASDVLLERSEIEAAMARREGRALLIVDIAVPRNVDPGVGQVFGVTLLDIDGLKAFAAQSLAQRRQEIDKVRGIITQELDRFRLERSAREVVPLISLLRARAEELRAAELNRFRSRLARLDPEARESVDALTRGLVNKLLHDPTVRIKDAAGTAQGELYANALAALFGLEGAPELAATPDPEAPADGSA